MWMREVLAGVDSVDELFELFGFSPDPHVLAVHRLHILKRFGIAVKQIDEREADGGPDLREALYASALTEAYEHYASGRGQAEPVIPVSPPKLVQLRIVRK